MQSCIRHRRSKPLRFGWALQNGKIKFFPSSWQRHIGTLLRPVAPVYVQRNIACQVSGKEQQNAVDIKRQTPSHDRKLLHFQFCSSILRHITHTALFGYLPTSLFHSKFTRVHLPKKTAEEIASRHEFLKKGPSSVRTTRGCTEWPRISENIFHWQIYEMFCRPMGCYSRYPAAQLDNHNFLPWCQQNIGPRDARSPCSMMALRLARTRRRLFTSEHEIQYWRCICAAHLPRVEMRDGWTGNSECRQGLSDIPTHLVTGLRSRIA